MNAIEPIVLGIIQGLTEFLPISSTAHLRLIPALLGWKDPGAAFTAVIQWGTWAASVIYFRHDIMRLLLAFFQGLRTGRPFATHDARLAWMIAVGTVPIVVFGLLLEKHIKGPFRSLYVIAGAAIVLALVMLAAEWWAARRRKAGTDLEAMGWGESLLVGFAQVVALVPGASRSGVTITGGLFAGLTRETAVRFSFLLSLPAVFGAGLHQLYKERHELLSSQDAVLQIVLATLISGVVGYAAIAFLIAYLRKHTTGVFIVYRIALGVLLLVVVSQGLVPANEGEATSEQARQSLAPAPATHPAHGVVVAPQVGVSW